MAGQSWQDVYGVRVEQPPRDSIPLYGEEHLGDSPAMYFDFSHDNDRWMEGLAKYRENKNALRQVKEANNRGELAVNPVDVTKVERVLRESQRDLLEREILNYIGENSRAGIADLVAMSEVADDPQYVEEVAVDMVDENQLGIIQGFYLVQNWVSNVKESEKVQKNYLTKNEVVHGNDRNTY